MLFFIVEMLFLSIVMWQYYKRVTHQYDMQVMYEMRECFLSKVCDTYTKIPYLKDNKIIEKLYKSRDIYMIFKNSNSYQKVSISLNQYQQKIGEIKIVILKEALIYTILLLLISILFAYYSIYPLKKALKLNDEFIKDILHDINTPLASLKINLKLLQKKFGNSPIIDRSQNSISTIVDMQSNLKYFLLNSSLQQEKFNIKDIINIKVAYYQSLFSNLSFEVEVENIVINSNKEAFSRIVDNLISNACKYNKIDGKVSIYYQNNTLIIEDSGVGIKEPQKIFDRYYKETQRGIGIGLHIVKKLCDETGVDIRIETEIGVGSRFILEWNAS